MKILGLQTDIWKPTRDDVYAIFEFPSSNKPKFLQNFTLCYWLKHVQYVSYTVHVTISNTGDSNAIHIGKFKL